MRYTDMTPEQKKEYHRAASKRHRERKAVGVEKPKKSLEEKQEDARERQRRYRERNKDVIRERKRRDRKPLTEERKEYLRLYQQRRRQEQGAVAQASYQYYGRIREESQEVVGRVVKTFELLPRENREEYAQWLLNFALSSGAVSQQVVQHHEIDSLLAEYSGV